MSAYIKRFTDVPKFSDPGSKNQSCQTILPSGIVPGMEIGYDVIEGPGRNGLHHHSGHQVLIVLTGRGLLIRGDERTPLEAACVVHIPPETDHDVVLEKGEHIEYVYTRDSTVP
jgi:mannose-6-phosphate isomerase-like protein (cupin superfamily)